MFLKFFFVLMICLLASLNQSCAQINVKKITYQALRQHDCRTNEPSAFCARSFAADYREYERTRQSFLSNEPLINSTRLHRVDILAGIFFRAQGVDSQ